MKLGFLGKLADEEFISKELVPSVVQNLEKELKEKKENLHDMKKRVDDLRSLIFDSVGEIEKSSRVTQWVASCPVSGSD